MRKSRFTDEQKIAILQQAASGTSVRELCRKHGITEQTFYRWREKLDGIQVPTPSASARSRMRIAG
jgi:putative transposase